MGNEPNLVLPVGPQSAEIMFILDSATEDEEKSGQAFCGDNEKQIKSLCKGVGINYEKTYRTTYLKQKLGYNGPKKKLRDESINEARAIRDYDAILKNEIFTFKPKVIVPLGELSLNFIAGEKSITKFRGSILPLRSDHRIENYNPKIIPTLAPRFYQIDPRVKVYVSLDFEKIAKQAQLNGFRKSEPLLWIADTMDKFSNFIERHKDREWGVFDIETKFNIPVCIGFCFSDDEACCVPLVDTEVDDTNELFLWKQVNNLLRNKKWVNQNIKFDLQKLTRYGFEIPEENIIGDTAIRSNIIYPEFPKNLAFLNSIYTDMPYYKDEGKESKERKTLYTYCAKDCLSTRKVYLEQELEIKEFGLEDFYKQIWNLFWPYVKMENRGIRIDRERHKSLLAKYDMEYDLHRDWLQKKTYKGFNPHSPDQVAKLIYKEWEIKEQKNRKTGSLETGEETLEYLLRTECAEDKHAQLVLELIIGCRKLHKVIEYCETIIHPDGRLRGSWDLGGTNTGRTSCKGTTDYRLYFDRKDKKWKFTDCGRSLQTITKHGFKLLGEWYGKDLRSIFVPSPNYVFAEGDLSAAEARVDAVLSEDYELLKTYDIPPGIHVKTGEWIFGRIIDKKKEPDLYHISKTVRHAGERNMGASRCMMILAPFGNFNLEFCEAALYKFHDNQPNIRQVFHSEVIDFVRNNRYLISPHGRRRGFFGKMEQETFNDAISMLPQATVSDQLKFSIPLIEEEMPGIRFLSENHDGLLVEIKRDEVDKFQEVFSKITSREIDFRNCSIKRDFLLTIPCEVSSGESWDDMRELKVNEKREKQVQEDNEIDNVAI